MTTELLSTCDIAAAIEAGKLIGNLKEIIHDGSRFVAVPKGYELRELPNVEGVPAHIREIEKVGTAEAFIAYFQRFANGGSLVFVDIPSAQFTGIIDYHEAEPIGNKASLCAHRVVFTAPETPEWQAWRKNNAQDMPQEDFAQFIEDMAPDLIEPDAATMLEVASTLQATTEVSFHRAIRLDNGQTQLHYNQQINGSAGEQGRLTIPTVIKIGVQFFRGGARYELDARFRYRLRNGGVKLRYELVRPEKAVEAALHDLIDSIKSGIAPALLIER